MHSLLPAETEMGIFRQILQGKIDFDSEPWPAISESAKDLIRKMLDRNPKRRLTAHQVLCKFLLLHKGEKIRIFQKRLQLHLRTGIWISVFI